MRQLLHILITLLISSCSTNYYLCSVDKPTAVYQTQDTTQIKFYIPQGKQLIAKKKGKKFRAVKYGDVDGYIVTQSFSSELPYSSKNLKYLTFNNDSTYTYARVSSSSGRSTSSSGGTVQVKGYYRKNGTYVKPHTRSAPKRKG
jgi:hypothetical protein